MDNTKETELNEDGFFLIKDKKYLGPCAVLDIGGRTLSLISLEPDEKGNHNKPSISKNNVEEYRRPVSKVEEPITRAEFKNHDSRLFAYWLLAEHKGGQLSAAIHRDLRHQAALVAWATAEDNGKRRRLLIADEVGLGKTIEIGLILKEIIRRKPEARVLYLCPGGLVANVLKEFEGLGLRCEEEGVYFSHFSTANIPGAGTQFRQLRHWVASSNKLVRAGNEDTIASIPWDIVIIDECHHYTCYGGIIYNDGSGDTSTKPTDHYRLVQNVLSHQKQNANEIRVFFLSGTPHQGSYERFLNLLSLLFEGTEEKRLSNEGNIIRKAKGKVIHRIKEEVKDYEDRRIFPGRRVNRPIILNMGEKYRSLYESVKDYFDKNVEGRDRGWAKAQALQLAASSPLAGYAYLLRRFARSFDTEIESDWFLGHLANLPGYREQETGDISGIKKALVKDADVVRSSLDDILTTEQDEGLLEPRKDKNAPLKSLIDQFAAFIGDEESQVKNNRIIELINENENAKFVVFAHSLDSVWSTYRFLRMNAIDPLLIVGGMSSSAREETINKFNEENSRVLVSSSAGGEGINLQAAHRLIHYDLPWNPMVLEQRIGRIHRIGSSDLIIVDTLLLEETKENEIYQRLVQRAWQVVCNLAANRERREYFLRRLMGNIPPERLKDIYVSGEDSGITEIIETARTALEETDGKIMDLRVKISEDMGRAKPGHLAKFLEITGVIKKSHLDNYEEHYFEDVSNDLHEQPEYFKDPSREAEEVVRKVEKRSVIVYSPTDERGFNANLLTTDRDAAFFLRRQKSSVELIGIDSPYIETFLFNCRVGEKRAMDIQDVAVRIFDRKAPPSWARDIKEVAAILFYFSARRTTEYGTDRFDVLGDAKILGFLICPGSPRRELYAKEVEEIVVNPPGEYPRGGEPYTLDKVFAARLIEEDNEIVLGLREQLPKDEDGFPDGAIWPLSVLLLSRRLD